MNCVDSMMTMHPTVTVQSEIKAQFPIKCFLLLPRYTVSFIHQLDSAGPISQIPSINSFNRIASPYRAAKTVNSTEAVDNFDSKCNRHPLPFVLYNCHDITVGWLIRKASRELVGGSLPLLAFQLKGPWDME